MTAALLGAGLSVLLFSAGLVVPVAGFVAACLAAVPIALIRLQGSRPTALAAIAVGGLALGFGFSPLIAAWYLVQCGLAGFLVADLALRGFTPPRTVLWSTVVTVLLTAALLAGVSQTTGFNPQRFMEQEISQALQQVMKLYETSGGLNTQDSQQMKETMTAVGQMMLRIYPALATLNLLLVCIITTGILFLAAARRAVVLATVPFTDFRAPELLIWPLIVAGFAMLAPSQMVTIPALNLLVVLGTIYFLQGLAVLLTLANRSVYRGLFKAFMVLMLLTQPYLAMIVVIIGIFDLWGDFRTPRAPSEENL